MRVAARFLFYRVDTQKENMTDQTTPDESGKEQEAPQTFTAEYVTQLREEAKARRLQTEALQAQIDKINAENEAAAAAKLAEQGEFKTLAEQRAAEIEALRPYKEQVETFKANAEKANAAFIEAMPEDRRTLIPPNLDPLELQAYLQTNRDLLIGQTYTPPATNGGAGLYTKPNPAVKLTPQEQEMARKMKMTDEEYAAHKR